MTALIKESLVVKPKAYSYIRFSSAKQAKGDSYRRQYEDTQEYIQKHGLELDEELNLKDLGVSAYTGDHLGENGALGQFIKAINTGRVPTGSHLIVESLDRLSRQKVTLALELFLTILRKGITIVTLQDKQSYSIASVDENYNQLLISLGIMARSHEESKIKSDRVHKAFNKKKKLAREEGIKVTKQGPAWCDWDEETEDFVLNPEKAALVQRMYDLALRDYGAYDITKILNDEGIERMSHSKHTTWEHAGVHHVLSTRTAIGWYQPTIRANGKKLPDGEPVPDYYPKVVDEDTFNRVQMKFASRKRGGVGAGRKGKHFANLFRGILECGYCGFTFTRSAFKYPASKDPNRAYLMCNGKTRRGCCDAPNVRYEPIEEQIMNTMIELDFDLIFDSTSTDNQRTKIQHDLEIKRAERAQNKKKLDRGLEMMFDSDDLPDSVLQKIKQFEEIDAELKKEIEILGTHLFSAAQVQLDNKEVKEKLISAIDAMHKCTDESELKDMRQNINAQMQSLLGKIVVWNGGQVASDQHFEYIERKARENGTWKENMFPDEMREAARKSMGSEYDKNKAQVTLTFKSGKQRTLWIDLKQNTSKIIQVNPNQKIDSGDPRLKRVQELRERANKVLT